MLPAKTISGYFLPCSFIVGKPNHGKGAHKIAPVAGPNSSLTDDDDDENRE